MLWKVSGYQKGRMMIKYKVYNNRFFGHVRVPILFTLMYWHKKWRRNFLQESIFMENNILFENFMNRKPCVYGSANSQIYLWEGA